MKFFKVAALFMLLGMAMTSKAQHSLSIDASQVISTFSFSNSVDPTGFNAFGSGDYQPNLTGAYSIGYRYDALLGLTLRGSFGMRNAGASTIIDETNYQWDLQYVEMKVGGGYRFDVGNKLGIYATASPYIAHLLKANQRLDNEDFDIKESGDLNEWDYGVYFSPGVLFTVSDYINAYGEFSYMAGLKNLETATNESGSGEPQKSHNIAYAFTLGLSFTIQ